MSFSLSVVGAALALAGALVTFWYATASARQSTKPPLPPGPPKKLLYGNAKDIPAKHKHLTFAKWSAKYGPVMHLDAFGRSVIILSSPKAVLDLLEKRSAIYSSRPRSHMADIMGYSSSTLLAPYGEVFRKSRRLMNVALNSRVTKTYWPIQERVAQDFAFSLLESPKEFRDHIKKATGSAILQVAYGYRLKGVDDPALPLVEQATYNFGLAVSGGFWIDYLPFLRFIPLKFWVPSTQKYIRDGRELSVRIREELHQYVKRDMAAGTAPPSFTSMLLSSEKSITGDPDEEELVKRTSAILYGAGSDSSAATLEVFFLSMVLFPEFQARAQAEIDAVVGPLRHPSMEDRENMPFVDALIKEIVRWGSSVPLGVPHCVIEDDVYEGMYIPKDSTVIANIWCLMRGEEYPEPETFNPDRFLVPNPPTDPFAYAFGFGRRQCPGISVATATTFLAVTTILHAFNIRKPVDPITGKEVTPTVVWTPGLINHAADHAALITPRSDAVADLIRASRVANESA